MLCRQRRREGGREGKREGGRNLLGCVVGRDGIPGGARLMGDNFLFVEEQVEGAEGTREGGREGGRREGAGVGEREGP
jgi:hypothetical protein